VKLSRAALGGPASLSFKELVKPQKNLHNRKFLIWKKRGRGWEREGEGVGDRENEWVRERKRERGGQTDGQVSRQAAIFKVRVGLRDKKR
jgi:hypothetical protein